MSNVYHNWQCKGLMCQAVLHGLLDLQYPFSRFHTMAVEREGRVMIQRGRTRSLHRLTEVCALCQTNDFVGTTSDNNNLLLFLNLLRDSHTLSSDV